MHFISQIAWWSYRALLLLLLHSAAAFPAATNSETFAFTIKRVERRQTSRPEFPEAKDQPFWRGLKGVGILTDYVIVR